MGLEGPDWPGWALGVLVCWGASGWVRRSGRCWGNEEGGRSEPPGGGGMPTGLAPGAGGEAGASRGSPFCLGWLPILCPGSPSSARGSGPERPPGRWRWRCQEGPCAPSGSGRPCVALPSSGVGSPGGGGSASAPRLLRLSPCDPPRCVGTARHSAVSVISAGSFGNSLGLAFIYKGWHGRAESGA